MKTQLINLFLLMKRMKCHSKGCQLPIWLVLLLVNVGMSAVAQSPARFPFQASVAGANGSPLANRTLNLRISLRDSATNGTLLYRETHAITTNAFGLFDVEIGGGVPVSGQITAINWAVNPKFIQTELDSGTGSWITLATTQLMSHPYALYAQTGGNGTPAGAADGQVLTLCDGQVRWTTGGACPSVGTLACNNIVNNGTLTEGNPATAVTSAISYTNANGGTYAAQTINSTGVTGLTASLNSGTLANGSGTVTYTITGTPQGNGTANFVISIGGQSCTFTRTVGTITTPTYPDGTVHCSGTPTAVVEVTNPTTGRIWMDRNLGASRAATSSTDAQAYGDLYQWGRRADGHQCRNSGTTTTLSSTDQPAHGNFILSSTGDWRSPQNNNLWQGVNGVNNPCPSGFRLPTETELNAERLSWTQRNSAGAFASLLRLPMAGIRSFSDGSSLNVGSSGFYWSSTVSGIFARLLIFSSSTAYMVNSSRADGLSVRCLKDAAVGVGSINTIDCTNPTHTGTLTSGTAASGATTAIAYTGGNGGTYTAQTITSTGVTGLTATLTAGTLATGNGTLTFAITGTPASSGTASFALSIGGQSCTFTRTVNLPAASLSTLDCTNPTHTGTLTSGIAASGVSTAISYTGGNGGTYTAQTITSTGVTGLTATLTAGTLANGNGTLTFAITGTPASSGTASFALTIGGQSCTFTRTVNLPAASLTALSCSTPTNTGTLTSGTAASGATTAIAYTGGNGGTYSAQTITSTGVTGLTATLTAGTLATGNGTLTFAIIGSPASSGTASFVLTIGGQSCTFTRTVAAPQPAYPTGTVHCSGTPTAVVEVTNPTTGRIWMDRNLGASRAATSSTDDQAYGDLYQWGRRADGHQCRTSGTTTTLSSTDQPAHGNFILAPNSPWDWRSPQNNNLWQGVNGVNNPCPSGYRLPTDTELSNERLSWTQNNSTGAIASPLKLPMAGSRDGSGGSLYDVGAFGYFWSSSFSGAFANYLFFGSSNAFMTSNGRALGFSVRCIKD